jgi:t-SNARE complex subunit (syntaxin)
MDDNISIAIPREIKFITYEENEDLVERLHEIDTICDDVSLLNEMMRDLSLMVTQQSELVDNIQSNIQGASVNVSRANDHLNHITRL